MLGGGAPGRSCGSGVSALRLDARAPNSPPQLGSSSEAAASPLHRSNASDDHHVHCVTCGTALARSSDSIEVVGKHEHVFINPHGLIFRIRCYATAVNVVQVGVPSADFSWFAGMLWQVTQCTGCRSHVGWEFCGQSNRFQTFISDQMLEC